MKQLFEGPLPLRLYGLCLAAAAGACLFWLVCRGRGKLKKGTCSLFALLALPLAFLCARLGLCLVSQGLYLFQQGFFFDFSRGGFMLYGAMAGIVLAAALTAKIAGESFPGLLDAAAPPGLALIAAARFSEGLIGVGYGRSIYDWFDPMLEMNMISLEDPEPLLRFPFGIQNYYGDWHWSIFLLEGVLAVVFVFLVLRREKKDAPGPGGLFLLALLAYASAQTWLESLREDAIPRWGFVRVNQLLSGVAVVLVLALSTLRLRRSGRPVPRAAWCGVLLGMGMIVAMEFAVEQKIPFLQWMKMDLCYLVMGLSSLALFRIGLAVWNRAWPSAEKGADRP